MPWWRPQGRACSGLQRLERMTAVASGENGLPYIRSAARLWRLGGWRRVGGVARGVGVINVVCDGHRLHGCVVWTLKSSSALV